MPIAHIVVAFVLIITWQEKQSKTVLLIIPPLAIINYTVLTNPSTSSIPYPIHEIPFIELSSGKIELEPSPIESTLFIDFALIFDPTTQI